MSLNTRPYLFILEEFDARFQDFKKFTLTFQFIRNPFIFEQSKSEKLSKLFNVSKTSLNYDISLLAEESQVKNELIDGMWRRLMSDHSFMFYGFK